jgi:hypothetical protein
MQKLKRISALGLLALLVAVPTASASTTDKIISDARDGTIDGDYTAVQLQAALGSPLLKTYGGNGGVEAVKSALGNGTTGSARAGNLPFTGAEVFTFAGIGGALVLVGFALRRSGRDDGHAV